jgi:endonuclease/exonuclease/phosphatase (EEP) superfamily protein YafD
VRNLGQPASEHPFDRAAWAATGVTFLLTLFGVALFRATADLWWPATAVLFGPRWILLLPVVPIAGLALLRDRALLVPLGVSSALLLGPLMGFGSGLRGLVVPEREDDLTFATLNVAGGQTILYGPDVLSDRLGADVMMIQECGGAFRNSILQLTGWHTAAEASLCAVSRFPILALAVMDRENLQSVGGSALVATFSLEVRGRPIHVTNVHLETPRAGLELILQGRVSEGGEVLRRKSILRDIELRRAERWAREQGSPALIMGDFNTPPESRHLRRIYADWTDAFRHTGFGIGGTRLNGWIRARIDYVMADDAWIVVDAKPGEPVGSDHLPVVARLRLRASP